MNEIIESKMRRDEMMRVAERERRVRQLLGKSGHRRQRSGRALRWVGKQLTNSGTYLQERYGAEEQTDAEVFPCPTESVSSSC